MPVIAKPDRNAVPLVLVVELLTATPVEAVEAQSARGRGALRLP
jgi:hypothetical protein